MQVRDSLPTFRYHPDPVATGTVVPSDGRCPVCDEQAGFAYMGPFYAAAEVEGLCPWCIASGAAARRYAGEFVDLAGCEPGTSSASLDELSLRTPSYTGWQQARWPVHCGEPCAFVGYVGWLEIEPLAGELAEDIEWICQEYRMDRKRFEESLVNGGWHQGYLFRCVACGAYRLLQDME